MSGATPVAVTRLDEFEEFYGREWRPENVVTVPGARLLHADRDALARDLGDLVTAGDLTDLGWLTRQVGVLSRTQAAQDRAQTRVRAVGPERRVHRPPRYTRAALVPVVLPAGATVLFDVKGCGVRPGYRPVPGGAHGLLGLGEAVHEVVLARLARTALRRAGHPMSPIGHYAIVDLGVDVLDRAGRPGEPAVLLVRQARTRPEFQWGDRDPGTRTAAELLDAELTLRRYGVTASSSGAIRFLLRHRAGGPEVVRDGVVVPLGPRRLARVAAAVGFDGREVLIDGVNVQVTTDRRMVDFGCYRLADRFTHALFAAADRDCETLRGLFVAPHQARYPQPVSSLAGAFDLPEWARLRDLLGGRAEPGRLDALLTAFLDRLPA